MTIILGGSLLIIEPISLSRLPELRRTQQILTFLISLVLIICSISFMTIIYSLSIKYRTNVYELIIILFWILYFASGMFIIERYDHNGLFVFAWLGIINIILTCIIIVFETVGFVIMTTDTVQDISRVPVTVIPIYTCLTCVILHTIIVILAFQLLYLIRKNRKCTDHQQI